MKNLAIAALSSVALLAGASAGFAAGGPVSGVEAAPAAQHMQLAGDANADFRCNDALRGDGASINPNVRFCTVG